MGQKTSLFKIWWVINKYIYRDSPVLRTIVHLAHMLESLLMGLLIWGTQIVFDSVAEAANGEGNLQSILAPVLIFTGISFARPLLNIIYNQSFIVMNNRNLLIMREKVSKKTSKLESISYEKPETLNLINKASGGIPYAFMLEHGITSMLTYNLPFFLFLGIYLRAMDSRLIWAIALALIPNIISMLIKMPLYSKLEDKSAPLRREVEAYDNAMASREFYKETRILGIYEFFRTKYMDSLKLLNRETWRTDSKSATFDLLMTFMTSVGYLGILYLMFASLSAGYITIGVFAAVFTSISAFIVSLITSLQWRFEFTSQNAGRVKHLVDFLELPEQDGEEKILDWTGDINLKDITFTYPNATKPSLNNLNLHIKAGETLAIVGENGAGKSTLTKVFMGIYEPDSGEVTVFGTSTKGVSASSRYKGISAIFQKFQRYQLTLKENIELGDIHGTGNLQDAIEQAGVALNTSTYPDGLETTLSREFGGVDLSGGQWQRVAIARGLYRQHDLIVLDEPTAAIDPIEESRLYEKFAEIAKDKTALIVTHRLGSAKIADRIIVMEDGQIAESGNHQELLQANGLYATMYKSQEQWYITA